MTLQLLRRVWEDIAVSSTDVGEPIPSSLRIPLRNVFFFAVSELTLQRLNTSVWLDEITSV